MAARKSYLKKKKEPPSEARRSSEATSGVPPEGKSKAPSDLRRWLDSGAWLGVFSIVTNLPVVLIIGRGVRDAKLRPQSTDYYNLALLLVVFPFAALSALLAVAGALLARKTGLTWGFRSALVSLTLSVVLLLASFAANPANR